MKMNTLKTICAILALSVASIVLADPAMAAPVIADTSLNIGSPSGLKTASQVDKRVLRLKNFLKGYPLEDSADHFITVADKYGFEKHPYLVAAIGMLESTNGKFIPPGSYNAWGFGIPTGAQSGIVFNTWNDGIEEVTKTIKTVYLKGKDPDNMSTEELVYFIGPIYAASPTWAVRVNYIFNQIENSPAVASSVATLPVDL